MRTKGAERVLDEGDPVLRAYRGGLRVYANLFHRLDVVTPCTLPRTGAAMVVCNHISSADPLFISAACSYRHILFMMAREYYVPGLRWAFDRGGTILVGRDGKDSGPLRAALRALEAGHVIGVFPEGRLAPTRELLPFQAGVGLMALKAGVPVYPAAIEGTTRHASMLGAVASPQEVRLAFGEAVPPMAGATAAEWAGRLREGVKALRGRVEGK